MMQPRAITERPSATATGAAIPGERLSVLFLTRYGRQGASSRYRFLQYIPALENAGMEVSVSPLLDDGYLARRYSSGRGAAVDLLRAVARRLTALLSSSRFDLVVLEKEILPYLPPALESLIMGAGVPYVVDYDDAMFHQYDLHRSRAIRRIFGDKIARVMRSARLVIAGNPYLADYAYRAGAAKVEILPTTLDLSRYPDARCGSTETFTIGWIGSPGSSRFLQAITPALAELTHENGVRLVLIGAGDVDLPGVRADVVPWSEATEVAELSRFDVGIMPLPDEPWTRGKCGFKLIQYMACGLPVVASPVGVNAEIVEPGVNGFLARSQAEWLQALRTLRSDREIRARYGAAGRRKVEQEYSLERAGPRLAGLLQQVIRRAPRRP